MRPSLQKGALFSPRISGDIKIHRREPQTASAVSVVSATCHKKPLLPSVSGFGLLYRAIK